jgi:membrane protein YdbS with pleckstrin-like domain
MSDSRGEAMSTTFDVTGQGQIDAEEPFAPPGVTWHHVSDGLTRARRISTSIWVVVILAVAAVLGWFWPISWLFASPLLAALIWGWFRAPRFTRAWGYAEREDDLLIRSGLLFQQMYVIPYGRMQFIDVQVGPLARRCGIATLVLHTASTEDDATLPGLPPEEAARLRDRLTDLGRARMAGL